MFDKDFTEIDCHSYTYCRYREFFKGGCKTKKMKSNVKG